MLDHVMTALPSSISALSSDLTPEELSRAKCDAYNSADGRLHLDDGYQCDRCRNRGNFLTSVFDEQFGYWSEVISPCSCDRVRKAIRRLNRSGLKEAVKRCTFEAYQVSEPWQERLKATVEDYAKTPGRGWLFIGGAVGCGKTHLCTAAAVKLLKRGLDVRYMRWREDAPKIKSVVNEGEEYMRLVEPLKTVDVLYIDDLFKTGRKESGERQRPTAADVNLAFEIISHRYDADLTTIVSSECTGSELADIDQAVAGRIIQKSEGHCISLTGRDKDYRLRGNVTL